jgi:hypothetical protein
MKKAIAIIAVICLIAGVGILVWAGVNGHLASAKDYNGGNLSTTDRTQNDVAPDPTSQDSPTVVTQLQLNVKLLDCGAIVEYGETNGKWMIIDTPDNENMFTTTTRDVDTKLTTNFTQVKRFYRFPMNIMNVAIVDRSYIRFTIDNSLRGSVGVNIECDAGYVRMADGDFQSINIDCEAGAVRLSDITANYIDIDTDAGAIDISDAVVSSYAEIDTEAGAVNVNGLDCSRVSASTDAGAVTLKQLSNLVSLSIETDVGAINAEIIGNKADYNIKVQKDLGSSNISDQSVPGSNKNIFISCDVGKITVNFR